MTHATIRFQYDTARFELYLDKLTGLPAPNIRKLFKLMLSEPWNNQTAIDAVEAFLPHIVEESKEAWRQTSVDFQNGWRLVPNKQSKKGRAIMAQNNRLHKAVKSAKGIHQHWVRIYGYAAYTERVRDEVGAKFQLIAWQPSTVDYEGVIGVWNTASHATISGVDENALVYWATGAHAGVAVNKSLTNYKYDGELIIDTEYTQAELEQAIKAGKFMLHNVNGAVRVLEDINTLLTLTDTKGEVFQSNQTIRVCDQIANDVAVLFNTRYVGTVPNDASGRASLWGDIVKLIQELEKIRAIENFDTDSVTCEQGDKKKAVLCTINGLNIVNAMSVLPTALSWTTTPHRKTRDCTLAWIGSKDF